MLVVIAQHCKKVLVEVLYCRKLILGRLKYILNTAESLLKLMLIDISWSWLSCLRAWGVVLQTE